MLEDTESLRQNSKAMGVMNIFICVFLMCHIGRYGCDAVKININPTKTIATTVNDIHISCLPDNDEDNGKQLTLIELSRNDQDTIVFVSQCGKISFGHDSSNRFQAVGHIDKVPGQSYLNVTLVNPESQDTGIYTCTMVYINTEGHLETETNSGNLQVENLDVKALEGVLNKMKDRMTSLEKENKDLLEKVTYSNFFMVSNKQQLRTAAGNVLVLPDIISRAGTGYDVKTGVFTSPVSGFYVFHLVSMSNPACHIHIHLMVNDKVVSILYAFDKDSWEQSSISSAVDLQAGDRVFCKAADSCNLYPKVHSVFTGYLIKAH